MLEAKAIVEGRAASSKPLRTVERVFTAISFAMVITILANRYWLIRDPRHITSTYRIKDKEDSRNAFLAPIACHGIWFR